MTSFLLNPSGPFGVPSPTLADLLALGAGPHPKSSTTPPRVGSGSLANIIDLTSGAGFFSLARAVAEDFLKNPPDSADALILHRSAAKPDDELGNNLDGLPLILVRQMADTEFWTAIDIQIHGKPWPNPDDEEKPQGIPAATVAVGADEGSSVTLDAYPFQDVINSAKKVKTDLSRLQRILVQAPFPEILFPLLVTGVRQEIRDPRTLASAFAVSMLVVDIVSDVVSVPLHRLKHLLQVPRPYVLKGPQPIIDTPPYMSYPGGHATLVHALATVFGAITDADDAEKRMLSRLANLIAQHRIDAGIHSEVDTEAGEVLGKHIGGCMVRAADDETYFPSWKAIFYRAVLEFQK